MVAKLLLKIEEIFLYLFDFEKEIKILKNNYQVFETKINNLENENEIFKNEVTDLREQNDLLKKRLDKIEQLVYSK